MPINFNQVDWRPKPGVLSQAEILNAEMQDARERGDTENAGYLRTEMESAKVPATFKVKAPDGSIINVNAPPGATEEQAIEFAAATWKPTKPAIPAAPKPEPGIIQRNNEAFVDAAAALGKGVGDVGLGAQKYLGKFANAIGADTVGNWLVNDAEQGKQKITGELAPHKARSPIAAGVGELGGNVLATLPVGGALAKVPQGLSKLPMLASQAPKLSAAANALRTGGLRTGLPAATTKLGKVGHMALRSGAAAPSAYIAQSLIDGNTNNAGTAAGIAAALPPGLKVAGEAGNLLKKSTAGLAKHTLGMTTGTGAESISAAYNAGKNKSAAFLDNMRGNVPFDDVVDDAKGALGKMREARAADYRSGMVDISNDKSVIPFKPIEDAVRKIGQMGSYKGQQINKNAAGTVDDLMATVDNWRGLDPAEYHTPEGLDALKQAIGDIRDTTQYGTAARRAADEVYNAVKNQITAQAPTYSKVMKDYSEASSLLKEIESGLSVGPNKSRDAAVRKLQSILRNNAQTNYGNRLNLARQLEEKGGADLMPSLAGQSMNAVMPRGITGAIQKGGALLTAAGTQGASIVPTLLAAPFTSPRLVGESLYGLGRLRGGAGSLAAKGGLTPAQLAAQPGLLEAQGLLYRAAPVMATSANRGSQR